MKLEDKLRLLKKASRPASRDEALERTLEYFRRLEQKQPARRLPAQRAPRGVEEYVEGRVESNPLGEFFLARQALPFGRPYGKLRVADLAAAELAPLNLVLEGTALPASSEVVYLDTETTGLAGGTGTLAFLIGLGTVEGSKFVVRQFFVRDYPEEKAMLAALAEALDGYRGLATFNGKTFDVPLLETRYTLARLRSPFARLIHLDLLHPARRLWKLRLGSCELTHLESEVLGVHREGDVQGSEIPGIYFDYLRTGDARGLQPVFYHNALDIITLAALAVEMARVLRNGNEASTEPQTSSLDLFSLSRIFDRVGALEQSVSTCQRALAAGLPESVESRALWHLSLQHKRRREHELAANLWIELTRREPVLAIQAYEELAIYYEHGRRDVATALEFVEAALGRLREAPSPSSCHARFTHRLQRLQRKSARSSTPTNLPLVEN